ncbi:MAG: restriction endonuclease subunit S, partial [Ruthenibacterium sp.]
VMQSWDFYKQADLFARGAAQRTIGLSSLAQIHIPIPPLAEQQRIVDILDRFDTLCNDISNGLPAEIKARQQQYEYYRDKLLTFKNIAEQEA